MQTINLKQYYPFCKEDIFVEVSDEIVEAFLLDKRAEAARERKMFRYKAFYSLDCNDGIENAAIGWAQPSPEDHLIEKEELKGMWRFGGQRGRPTPTGRWNLPVDRSALTTAVTSGRALIKSPLSIWDQPPAKWKSEVSAPTREK